MRGLAGLTGWQWLFILEGLFTVISGAVFACLFRGHQITLFRWPACKLLSERERSILRDRILLDDPTKEIREPHIKLRMFLGLYPTRSFGPMCCSPSLAWLLSTALSGHTHQPSSPPSSYDELEGECYERPSVNGYLFPRPP